MIHKLTIFHVCHVIQQVPHIIRLLIPKIFILAMYPFVLVIHIHLQSFQNSHVKSQFRPQTKLTCFVICQIDFVQYIETVIFIPLFHQVLILDNIEFGIILHPIPLFVHQ